MSKAWVLVDDKVGSSNQAIALAKLLNLDHQPIKLEYNLLAKLPNFLNLGLYALSNRTDVIERTPPKIIISSGRRTAAIALALKKHHKNIKLIHILNPSTDFKHFDAIILPEHDRKPTHVYFDNIIYINGAITFSPKDWLKNARQKWEVLFNNIDYPQPKIGVLIGGSSKGSKFYIGHARILADRLLEAAAEINGSILVTTSRRTPVAVSHLLKKYFQDRPDIPTYFYDVNSTDENPYQGILACSDYLVVTGDSINMCCEAIETKLPTFVFSEDNMLSKKHQKFVDSLCKAKLAKKFKGKVFKFNAKGLSSSEIIMKKLNHLLEEV